ncbi:MAG: hypothetical protein H7A08_07245 [Oceanospirillaceae bacterium]|nr:hypothetical protein [Oceanospirillaceae bacterium]
MACKTLTGLILLAVSAAGHAASCCGGGAGSALILPKFNQSMWSISTTAEHYDGYWDQSGRHKDDPDGSELNQYTLNAGYVQRLAPNWQLGASLPLVMNDNQYSGDANRNTALGDASVFVWYETFDNVTCIYKIRGWQSLRPSVYLGANLVLPTGISPYTGHVDNSAQTTGRGFYRLDANLSIEKTIYPWSAAFNYSHGEYLSRMVNNEYGTEVEPYRKSPAARRSLSGSLAYTWFFSSLDMLNLSYAYSELHEGQGTIDGTADSSSDFHKISHSLSLGYVSPARDWNSKISISDALRGHGTVDTQSLSLEFNRVY